jgi:hypothetical protein
MGAGTMLIQGTTFYTSDGQTFIIFFLGGGKEKL